MHALSKRTREKTSRCFMPMTGSALYLKRSKKDDVKVIEIGSEESDYPECLASKMPHSSAHSDGLKSTRS